MSTRFIIRFLIIKRFTNDTIKYFTIDKGDSDFDEIPQRIIQELKNRHIRNIGEFIIISFIHRDSMYLSYFTDGFKCSNWGDIVWAEGPKILKHEELHIIAKELERLKNEMESE